MKLRKFFSHSLAFSFAFFICCESYADEARVYCISTTGSWNWLYKFKGEKIDLFNVKINIASIIRVEGKWKRKEMNNGNVLRYFIIKGGVDSFLVLETECNQKYGVDSHAQPTNSSNSGYHPFAISDDNIISNGYIISDLDMETNNLQYWFRS